MTIQELRDLARELGFARLFVASARSVEGWRQAAGEGERFARMTDDPNVCLPGVRSALLLAYPYAPYAWRADEPRVDAYYVASNAAHERARELANALEARGFAALASPPLPLKPLAARCGLGEYGRNTLLAAEGFGSRAALQAVLTTAELPPTERGGAFRLDEACSSCGRCVKACPTGALRGDGTLDVSLCLRAAQCGQAVPEALRPLIGASLLGCDLCQRVCPRNARVASVEPPEALREALSLERLLAGEREPLARWIGANNARKTRLQAAAALAAGNLGRRELSEALSRLTDGYAGEHARWALAKLQKPM